MIALLPAKTSNSLTLSIIHFKGNHFIPMIEMSKCLAFTGTKAGRK